MKIKQILENFELSSKYFEKEQPIFSFPLKSSEKKELLEKMIEAGYNMFRFIADSKKKKLYIFNINYSHEDADKKLGLNQLNKRKNFEEDYPYSFGFIHYKNGNFFINTHSISKGCEFVWEYVKKGSGNENKRFNK